MPWAWIMILEISIKCGQIFAPEDEIWARDSKVWDKIQWRTDGNCKAETVMRERVSSPDSKITCPTHWSESGNRDIRFLKGKMTLRSNTVIERVKSKAIGLIIIYRITQLVSLSGYVSLTLKTSPGKEIEIHSRVIKMERIAGLVSTRRCQLCCVTWL